MNIVKNITDVRDDITAGRTSGVEVANEAVQAISDGLGSDAWEKLMNRYAKTPQELDRLCGREQKFNDTQWGKFCLVYIAGDSTCTSETAQMTGTGRSMTLVPEREMLKILDEDL